MKFNTLPTKNSSKQKLLDLGFVSSGGIPTYLFTGVLIAWSLGSEEVAAFKNIAFS